MPLWQESVPCMDEAARDGSQRPHFAPLRRDYANMVVHVCGPSTVVAGPRLDVSIGLRDVGLVAADLPICRTSHGRGGLSSYVVKASVRRSASMEW
jgi:hypothetical protein